MHNTQEYLFEEQKRPTTCFQNKIPSIFFTEAGQVYLNFFNKTVHQTLLKKPSD